MTDFLSKEKRSKVMSAIPSRGNKSTELAIIKVFRENKITGWRRNYKLEGKPDFVFPKAKLVVFVDGCFWHGHKCIKPRASQEKDGYWKEKIIRTKKRDRMVTKSLRKQNWVVVRVWECELEKKIYERKLRIIKKQLGIVKF